MRTGATTRGQLWRESLLKEQSGFSLLEISLAVAFLSVLLLGSVISVRPHAALRELRGWSDAVVSDLRAAQQASITRRASVLVTFSSRGGGSPASYVTTVGAATIRQETLPLPLDVTAGTVQFNSLGGTAAVATLTLSHSGSGRTRTITVASVTGTVTASEP